MIMDRYMHRHGSDHSLFNTHFPFVTDKNRKWNREREKSEYIKGPEIGGIGGHF